MKRFVLLLAAIVCAAGSSIASAARPEPAVPAGLAVPDGNKVFLVGHATGV